MGRTNWASCIRNLLFNLGFGNVWHAQEQVNDVKLFLFDLKNRLIDIDFQNLNSRITDKSYIYFNYNNVDFYPSTNVAPYIASVDEISDRRLLMEIGSCLIIVGGWLDSVWTYSGGSLGFLYSLYFSLSRSRVMPRKFVDSGLLSMVMLRPCDLKRATRSFFIISIRGPGIRLGWLFSRRSKCRIPTLGNCV